MEDPVNTFELSSEQRDTRNLLHELLGHSIAARYEDFCRLSAGVLVLNVSTPVAAHALRELESMLRTVLQVPMDAVAVAVPGHNAKLEAARKLLANLKFDQEAINSAVRSLEPRINHKTQVRKIVSRLGLDPNGDIANLWAKLTDTNEVVHGRSFHKSLKVDDDFRTNYQRPFDAVIRAVALALRRRYATMVHRVDDLATSTNYRQAVASFKAEIPGAMQLQWRFYHTLATGHWIPHLMKAGLLGEPIDPLPGGPGVSWSYREWPAGSYLLRMASSTDATTRNGVVDALRAVSESDHPDIRQNGIAILAALPPEESAPLTDLAVAWIRRAGAASYLLEPDNLVKKLAAAKQTSAALQLGRELLRLSDNDGQIASHHRDHMYEHHLPSLIEALTAACGIDALHLVVDLLRQAVSISSSARYGYLSTRPIAEGDLRPNDIFEVLVKAARRSAELLIEAKVASTSDVVGILANQTERIFVRLCLFFLSQDPSSAQMLASSYLLNEDLIPETGSRAEYDALARAWFPSLPPGDQSAILSFVDTLPDKYYAGWRNRFEARCNRTPNAEDEQVYRIAVVTEVLWGWRAVLPCDLREAIEKSGDPYAWHMPTTMQEESPIKASDFSSTPVAEIIAFLKDWQPAVEPHRQTVTALAQALHSAAFASPSRYSADADEFGSLKPVYIRQLMDGLQYGASNRNEVNWGKILRLIAIVFTKDGEAVDTAALSDGDDQSWDWAIKAASKLLVVGLRLGPTGIPREHTEMVRSLVATALTLRSKTVNADDFEERFERHPYFTAQDTSLGIATELCILLVWWMQVDVPAGTRERAAIVAQPEISQAFESQMTDRTMTGRISRAVFGRYLRLQYYNDAAWLKAQITAVFPANSDALRQAAWHSHLMNDQGPIGELISELEECYLKEVERLSSPWGVADDDDRNVRQRRFASYVMVLVLEGKAPDRLIQQFLVHAPDSVRRSAMWFVGDEVSKPLSVVPEDARRQGISYWERRLATAIADSDRSRYREELGAISRWCFHGVVDELWLCDQLLAMTEIELGPSDWHDIADWLHKVATRHVDRAVEILLGLIRISGVERWVYTAGQGTIRFVLTEGRDKGTLRTIDRVSEAVNHLASLGETNFLDLDPPRPAQ
jgi:hypothetical protein